MKWPWRRRREPSREVVQARRRLERIRADDEAIERLARRAGRILRENDLAPNIIKALRLR